MEALVLDNQDPQRLGRIMVAEGWALPVKGQVPPVGSSVWVIKDTKGNLRYRKLRNT